MSRFRNLFLFAAFALCVAVIALSVGGAALDRLNHAEIAFTNATVRSDLKVGGNLEGPAFDQIDDRITVLEQQQGMQTNIVISGAAYFKIRNTAVPNDFRRLRTSYTVFEAWPLHKSNHVKQLFIQLNDTPLDLTYESTLANQFLTLEYTDFDPPINTWIVSGSLQMLNSPNIIQTTNPTRYCNAASMRNSIQDSKVSTQIIFITNTGSDEIALSQHELFSVRVLDSVVIKIGEIWSL